MSIQLSTDLIEVIAVFLIPIIFTYSVLRITLSDGKIKKIPILISLFIYLNYLVMTIGLMLILDNIFVQSINVNTYTVIGLGLAFMALALTNIYSILNQISNAKWKADLENNLNEKYEKVIKKLETIENECSSIKNNENFINFNREKTK